MTVSIPSSSKPARYSWRAKERNIGGKGIETPERQVVGMRMSQQESMKRGQTADRNPGRTHPREKAAQPFTEVRIGQHPDTSKVQQQSGVTYVRDTHLQGGHGYLG